MTRIARFRAPETRISKATVVAAAVLLLVGCSQVPTEPEAADGPSEASSPSATAPAPPESPCDRLQDATVLDLVGMPLEGREQAVPGTDLVACWYGDSDHALQFGQAPAGDWARSLPDVVATLRDLPDGAVDPELLEQLEERAVLIEDGTGMSDEEACGYFSRLLEATGYAAGSAVSVNFLPDAETALAVSGQQCIDGMYTTLLVARPDAADAPGLAEKIETLLADL